MNGSKLGLMTRVVSRRVWSNRLSWFGSKSNATRGAYAEVNNDDIQVFRSIVGDGNVITDPEDLKAYNVCWMKHFTGKSKVCVRPKSTKEVSEILRHCNQRKIALVPQGGNTGMVGGSVPVFDEVILSMARMNRIRGLDSHAGVVEVEAGVILDTLAGYLGPKGFIPPLDLGAKGSCMLGGNVSTNAGGVRLVRYGSLQGSVLGLEVVLADGRVLDGLSMLRKDNSGYHLNHLFIGSEGTLGVVTAVSLLVPRKPTSSNVMLLSISSWENVLKVLELVRGSVGEILSALELLDQTALNITLGMPGVRPPFDKAGEHPFNMLIETSGFSQSSDKERMQQLVEHLFDKGMVEGGTVAQDETQFRELWALRENQASEVAKKGWIYKYDISIPLDHYYDLVYETRDRLKKFDCFTYGYGHLGDSNLHLNICSPKYNPEIEATLEPWVFQRTAELKGSISAEHGVGVAKRDFVKLSKSPVQLQLMATLKQTLDPNAILNPYKVVPSHSN